MSATRKRKLDSSSASEETKTPTSKRLTTEAKAPNPSMQPITTPSLPAYLQTRFSTSNGAFAFVASPTAAYPIASNVKTNKDIFKAIEYIGKIINEPKMILDFIEKFCGDAMPESVKNFILKLNKEKLENCTESEYYCKNAAIQLILILAKKLKLETKLNKVIIDLNFWVNKKRKTKKRERPEYIIQEYFGKDCLNDVTMLINQMNSDWAEGQINTTIRRIKQNEFICKFIVMQCIPISVALTPDVLIELPLFSDEKKSESEAEGLLQADDVAIESAQASAGEYDRLIDYMLTDPKNLLPGCLLSLMKKVESLQTQNSTARKNAAGVRQFAEKVKSEYEKILKAAENKRIEDMRLLSDSYIHVTNILQASMLVADQKALEAKQSAEKAHIEYKTSLAAKDQSIQDLQKKLEDVRGELKAKEEAFAKLTQKQIELIYDLSQEVKNRTEEIKQLPQTKEIDRLKFQLKTTEEEMREKSKQADKQIDDLKHQLREKSKEAAAFNREEPTCLQAGFASSGVGLFSPAQNATPMDMTSDTEAFSYRKG